MTHHACTRYLSYMYRHIYSEPLSVEYAKDKTEDYIEEEIVGVNDAPDLDPVQLVGIVALFLLVLYISIAAFALLSLLFISLWFFFLTLATIACIWHLSRTCCLT